MKCPSCQHDNPADGRFGGRCGSAIEETSPTLSYSPAEEAAGSQTLRFRPGEKFGERYTIIEEIGQGGMGRVYKAEDHELGITVVLKMIRPDLSSRPQMIKQFRKETLLGRSISHENVVRIHDLGEINKIKYISMDFVNDFGLAKSASPGVVQPSEKSYGTPKYFSPEQARGMESDERSDIYSLGAVLFEMATGIPPFKADTVTGYIQKHTSEKPPLPSRINPAIPPAFEKIILKCLEKKRDDRYQTVDELLKDLAIKKEHIHACAAEHSPVAQPGSDPASRHADVPGSTSTLAAPHRRPPRAHVKPLSRLRR